MQTVLFVYLVCFCVSICINFIGNNIGIKAHIKLSKCELTESYEYILKFK